MKTQNKARTSDLSRQRFSIKNGSMTPPRNLGRGTGADYRGDFGDRRLSPRLNGQIG